VTRFYDSLSFRTKLILVISLLVVGISGATVWRLQQFAQTNFLKRFEASTETTRQVTQRSIEERLGLLEKLTEQMAGNPRLLAALSVGDDPATFQDLIQDPNEGFSKFFRDRYGVLLYKKAQTKSSEWVPSQWIEFDRYQIEAPSGEISALMERLSAQLGPSQLQWKGQLSFGSDQTLQVYLVSAYLIPEHRTLLILADPVNRALARDLRNLALESQDHLVLFLKDQIVGSTFPPEAQAKELSQLVKEFQRSHHTSPSPGVRKVRIGNESFLGAMDSLADLGAAVLEGSSGQRGASYLLLKSQRGLQGELSELNTSLLGVGLVGLLFAIGIATLVSMSLARPIQQLKSFASDFGQGQTERRLNLDRFRGEFAQLAQAFDTMQLSLLEKTRQLVDSEQQYRMLIENSTQAITGLFVKDGRMFAANQAFSSLTGYSNEELESLTFLECFFEEEGNQAQEILWELELIGLVSRSIRLRRNDEKERFVEVNLSVVEREPELKALVIFTDQTEKKSLEKQLIQAQKMDSLGTLAGGVAHDFNNLLTAIIGYSSLALNKTQKDDPRYNHLIRIERSGQRAKDLTRNLLSFSRPTDLQPRPINLNQVVEEVIQILSRTLEKNVQLQTNLASSLDVVEADPGQLEPILMNLCINARDAMPEGGTITIETSNQNVKEEDCVNYENAKAGSYVRLAVTDTGVGMDAETKKRIFEPFFTTKEVSKGTGLGLSIVYGIVKAHGGFLNLYSEVGEGTTFIIYLPTVKKAADTLAPVEKEIRGGSERVLLVDDEEDVLALCKEVLTDLGYRVDATTNPLDAVEWVQKSGPFDLVVIDLVMPELSGREVYEQIRSHGYEGRTLIASGYSVNETAQEMLDRGADGFIQKPYRVTELAHKVREILDRIE